MVPFSQKDTEKGNPLKGSSAEALGFICLLFKISPVLPEGTLYGTLSPES